MLFLTNWIELNALHSYCLSLPSFCKWTKLSYTRQRDDVLTAVLPSPSWSNSLLRLVNPDYVWITILRNVGKYKSSRRNTPEDLNRVSHYPSIFLISFLFLLPHLQHSVRPISMSQLSFASLHVCAVTDRTEQCYCTVLTERTAVPASLWIYVPYVHELPAVLNTVYRSVSLSKETGRQFPWTDNDRHFPFT